MNTKIIDGVTYTHRTKAEGFPARIICTNNKHLHSPVLALCLYEGYEHLLYLNQDLMYRYDVDYDLLEGVEPEPDWSKVAVDTPVWVRDLDTEKWEKRHFAGVGGKYIRCFFRGRTSFTSEANPISWLQASLTDPTVSTSK